MYLHSLLHGARVPQQRLNHLSLVCLRIVCEIVAVGLVRFCCFDVTHDLNVRAVAGVLGGEIVKRFQHRHALGHLRGLQHMVVRWQCDGSVLLELSAHKHLFDASAHFLVGNDAAHAEYSILDFSAFSEQHLLESASSMEYAGSRPGMRSSSKMSSHQTIKTKRTFQNPPHPSGIYEPNTAFHYCACNNVQDTT